MASASSDYHVYNIIIASTKGLYIDPKGGRGHVTISLPCVPRKTQIRQWFVTNYSNNCPLDCTMSIEDLYYI
jgi:hypothetical protein